MLPLFQVFSLMSQLLKKSTLMQETWVRSLGWKDPLEKGTGYPLLYSGLENSMHSVVLGPAEWNVTHFLSSVPRSDSSRQVKVKVAQLCLTPFDTMEYTAHGFLQARILEWGAFAFSK